MFGSIFVSVLLPLILIAGAAYLLGRFTHLEPGPLARVTFYLFNPSLVFVTLAGTTASQELMGRLALLKILVCVLLILTSLFAARRMRSSPPAASALALSAAFANSGNFGLSVSEYAFGQAGLALAVICYVADNAMINSLGVYLAARGRTSVRRSILQVFLNPALYAVPLGLAANRYGWVVPLPLERPLEMLSRAAVPTMLVVLGLQLAALPVDRRHWQLIGVAGFLRLGLAPLLALVLAVPLGLTGLARQVGILQAAVPSAVTASIIAARYNSEPNQVAGSVLVTSLVSLLTVTAVLSWMA
jgi:malate permease and related proteins